jgi:hypothetical protein
MLLVFDRIFSTGQKERLRGAQAALAEYLHQYNKMRRCRERPLYSACMFARGGKTWALGWGRRVPDSPEEREGEEMEQQRGGWVCGNCHRSLSQGESATKLKRGPRLRRESTWR